MPTKILVHGFVLQDWQIASCPDCGQTLAPIDVEHNFITYKCYHCNHSYVELKGLES